MKTPISLIIDDAAPVVSVYYTHAGRTATKDGRPLAQYYPNSLFFRFCDIAERYGLRGKFSVVPMPGNLGSVAGSIEGVSGADLSAWLEGVKQRLCPAFSVCPEMLTHNFAVDLATGAALPLNEQEWASEGTGVGQLTPAEPNSGSQQQPEEPTIDIGEGQSGSFGFWELRLTG